MGKDDSPISDEDKSQESYVLKGVKGVKLNVRRKDIDILVQCEGRDEEDWEPIDTIAVEDRHFLQPFQSAIEYLQSIDLKKLGANDLPHDEEGDTDEEYEVESVLGIMHNGSEIMYYIKWCEWNFKYNNWEPEDNCSCEDLIAPFSEAAEKLREYNVPRRRSVPTSKSRATSKGSSRNNKRVKTSTRTSLSPTSTESDEPAPKRPGPKSRTRIFSPAGSPSTPVKRPGPKSRTMTISNDEDKNNSIKDSANGGGTSTPVKKKPGPKSRTLTPSFTAVSYAKEESSDSSLAAESNVLEERRSTVSESEASSKNDLDQTKESPKKRPGPLSRTSSSVRKPGPKSRTMIADDDDDSSDY